MYSLIFQEYYKPNKNPILRHEIGFLIIAFLVDILPFFPLLPLIGGGLGGERDNT